MKTLIAAILAMFFSMAGALAETYPAYPVHLIVPYSAGGPSDIIARLISQKASGFLGQPIVIDNRGGAGGVPGTNLAVMANPDGYTSVMVSPGQVGIEAATMPQPPYNPMTDLVPVIELVEDTLVLCVSNKLPVTSVPELVAYMKAHPDELNYSSASIGSITHMTMELFKHKFSVEAEHVPYNGSSESMMAIVSGQVSLGFASPSGMQGLLRDHKLRALAIASAHRSSMIPEVPTFSELGYPQLNSPLFYIIALPKGAPDEITHRLYAAYSKALEDKELQDRLRALGVDVVNADGAQAGKTIADDVARWRSLAAETHLKLQ